MEKDGGVIRDVSWKDVVSDSFLDLSTPVTDAERVLFISLTLEMKTREKVRSISVKDYIGLAMVALILFSSLTETIGNAFQPHFSDLQALLLKCLHDETSNRVRVAALKAVGSFLEFTNDGVEVGWLLVVRLGVGDVSFGQIPTLPRSVQSEL
ncbi:hypothetical protein EZV62_018186 [Acer yangbiense]|uniref:IPO4/5-like TPR repeats domain-containing protein n=1 Tax=Acer yangbiense TaxID=1000413 RepID=A0A5C7HIL1_9ROSI|nr:hypothetical protein EZV62_018186 [Acer yangbiense]